MLYSLIRSILTISLLFITIMAFASPDDATGEIMPISSGGSDEISAADLERLMNRELATRFAPIKSAEDLSAYLDATSDNVNPFNRLSPAARTRFLESLYFSERGLGSFEYEDMVYELTPTEIYKILYLFGMQHLVNRMQGARIETSLDEQLLKSSSVISIDKAKDNTQSKMLNKIEIKNRKQPINQIQFLCISAGLGDSCGGEDHDDKYCDGQHTCRVQTTSICTSNC